MNVLRATETHVHDPDVCLREKERSRDPSPWLLKLVYAPTVTCTALCACLLSRLLVLVRPISPPQSNKELYVLDALLLHFSPRPELFPPRN